VGTELYLEISEALFREADLLDNNQLNDWLAFLADDIVYQAPVRLTRERAASADFSEAMQLFDERHATLSRRIERLYTEFAWAEDPPSRTRRFVSNIRVRTAVSGRDDELDVTSYLLVYRSRGSSTQHDLISARRDDVLRKVDGAWRLARRRILVDQSVLGTRNLAIFL
jgi:3-phenylpropionate/cinnamic acid dioxygenase small subunit